MYILLKYLLLIVLPLGLAQDGPEENADARIHVVQKDTFKDAFTVTGRFMPADAVELGFKPRAYRGQLEVKEVVEPGTRVHKGEVLAHFDMEAIDEQIENARLELKTATQNFEDAVAQRRMTAMDLEAERESAEMEYELAEEGLKGYREIGIPLEKERSELTQAYAKHSIEDQTDELEQLGKMYKEDELTEETEEIVLKRSKRNLDRSKWSLDIQKRQRAYDETYSKTAQLKRMIKGVQAKKRAMEKIMIRGDSRLVHADVAVERARRSVEKAEKSLNDLIEDRGGMFIESPRDGLLLHGSKKLEGPELKEGMNAAASKTMFTVAEPGSFLVGFVAPEKEVLYLKKGMLIICKPAAMPGMVMEGELHSIAKLPSAQKKGFECSAKIKGNHQWFLPGMSAEVRIDYKLEDVLVVPKEAVKEEDGRFYCEVETADGGKKRPVTTGRSDDENTVIIEGLEEGDRVLIEKPGEKAAPPDDGGEKNGADEMKEKLRQLGYK